jgi:hypothetical protein
VIRQLLRQVARELVQYLLAGLASQLAELADHQVTDQHASDQLTAQDRDRRHLGWASGIPLLPACASATCFLKIDADQTRTDVEVEAMVMAPVPTPEVLWRKPPVLALAALPGTALGRLGEPSTASPTATCRSPTCSPPVTRSPA